MGRSLASPHRLGAAEAALAGATVDTESAGHARQGDLLGVGEVGAQQPGGDVDEAAGERLTEVADGCERVQLARPQDLAAVHVADAAEHSLVEQHLADRGAAVVVGEQQLDASVEVGVDAAQVGTESPEPRVPRDSWLPVRLDGRGVEAHGGPGRRLDEGAHLAVGTLPDVVLAVEVPEPALRRWVCRMMPSSHSISRCLPVLSTRTIVRPALGTTPISCGASKRTIFLSTRAIRIAAAVRWIESPSDTDLSVRDPRREWSMVTRAESGRTPQWARARRMRRSWPPVI